MNRNELGQFFTPAWAAEILFDFHFSHLKAGQMVWEPTCGSGNMLAAIPKHINCIGSEIDPILAFSARMNSGRDVLNASCLDAELPAIDAVFGNPPFKLVLFEKLLQRCESILALGSKAGFVLPAYFLQTSRTVIDLSKKWGVYQEIIPRDLFPGLSKPLIFASFVRDNRSQLFGFRLFDELASIKQLSQKFQNDIRDRISGSRSVWREAVSEAMRELGGVATLERLYAKIQGKRPTDNQFWKEQIRKICQSEYKRLEKGVYSL